MSTENQEQPTVKLVYRERAYKITVFLLVCSMIFFPFLAYNTLLIIYGLYDSTINYIKEMDIELFLNDFNKLKGQVKARIFNSIGLKFYIYKINSFFYYKSHLFASASAPINSFILESLPALSFEGTLNIPFEDSLGFVLNSIANNRIRSSFRYENYIDLRISLFGVSMRQTIHLTKEVPYSSGVFINLNRLYSKNRSLIISRQPLELSLKERKEKAKTHGYDLLIGPNNLKKSSETEIKDQRLNFTKTNLSTEPTLNTNKKTPPTDENEVTSYFDLIGQLLKSKLHPGPFSDPSPDHAFETRELALFNRLILIFKNYFSHASVMFLFKFYHLRLHLESVPMNFRIVVADEYLIPESLSSEGIFEFWTVFDYLMAKRMSVGKKGSGSKSSELNPLRLSVPSYFYEKSTAWKDCNFFDFSTELGVFNIKNLKGTEKDSYGNKDDVNNRILVEAPLSKLFLNYTNVYSLNVFLKVFSKIFGFTSDCFCKLFCGALPGLPSAFKDFLNIGDSGGLMCNEGLEGEETRVREFFAKKKKVTVFAYFHRSNVRTNYSIMDIVFQRIGGVVVGIPEETEDSVKLQKMHLEKQHEEEWKCL